MVVVLVHKNPADGTQSRRRYRQTQFLST